MKKTLMLGAALALGLGIGGSAYAGTVSGNFLMGGSHGVATTHSGGGSSSQSGSIAAFAGIAGGETSGFSKTEGGAQVTGDETGVTTQDFRNSKSGADNISGALGLAGTENGSQAAAGGHEGAFGSYGNFGAMGQLKGL